MLGFIGNIGPWELVFILIIALIVVGPGKLPEVAKSMGKAINEFKKTSMGVKKEFQDAIKMDNLLDSKPSSSTEPQVAKATSAEEKKGSE